MFNKQYFSITLISFLLIPLIFAGCSKLQQGLVPPVMDDVVNDTLSIKPIESISDGITQVALQASSVEGLKGYSVILSHDAALLTVEEVSEGDFLTSQGETFFYKEINEEEGTVQIDCVLLGKDLSVSGTGTLVILSITDQKSNSADLTILKAKVSDSTNWRMDLTRADAQSAGDFNSDGKVDFEDLMLLSQVYGLTLASSSLYGKYDLNADKKIDFEDLMIFSIYYEGSQPQYSDAIIPQNWATGNGTASNPWANDCIKKAVNVCPEGGTVYLKAGYYQLTDSIVIKNSYISIIGEGVSQTIIKTGTGDGLNLLNVDHVTIKGFSLDGALQPDKHPWYYDFAPRTIAVSNSSYLTFEDLEIKNSGSYGMNLFNMSHSLLKNVQVYDSYFHNIHPGYTNGSDPNGNSYNTYENIYVANSEIGGGFCETGNANYPNSDLHNVYINIKAEYNASNGVDISNQTGGTVTGCTATGNTKRGFPLYNIEDFTVTNCTSKDNGWQGFHVELNSNNIELNNCTATENGSEGIRIEDSTNVTLTDCTSTSNGTYGLTLLGNSDYITLDGCTLTPNKSGEINDPYAIAVIKSKEIMLAKL